MTPDDKTPTPPALPLELRRGLFDLFGVRDAHTIEMLIAPLWPRPAAVTADARELAFDIVARIGPRIVRTPDCGDRSVFHVAAEEVAAVLAPLLAELNSLRSQVVRLERDAYLGDDDEKRDLRAQLAAAQAQAREAMEKYNDLLFAVARKFDGETRHQTALRYIQEAEDRATQNGPDAARREGGRHD